MNIVKIMIVEDELIAAESLSLDLKRLGYNVTAIVDSGEKAIQTSSEFPPDLILMDIMLKGDLDGITAAETIYHRLSIPIVYLSAYADNQTLDRAKQTAPYGYLVKPYKSQELKTTIEIALYKHQQEQNLIHKLAQEIKVNQIKTHALAVASHDLRTPLTSILGYTELLRDFGNEFDDDKKQKYFDFIKSAVTHMNESLEDLLLISKAEENRIKVEPEQFDIVDFCDAVLAEFQPTLTEQHNLILDSNVKSDRIFLDPKLLRHILNNLISNAIKYSPKGGDIFLKLISHENEIIFEIKDKGIGIPDSYQTKLFQLFERGDNVGDIEGNGLGLSIVKKAVELLKGEIKVSSEQNIGTTFTITIPKEVQELQ